MQIATVDIERTLLLGHGLGDDRVSMTDTGHIVVHVDITPSIGVVKVGTFAANDVQRFIIKKLCANTQGLLAA
jgi:hypothetical protein